MDKFSLPGLTLSATSFLIHEDYLPAIRFAAQRCDDVALLLLETGDDGGLLPSKAVIKEIRTICDGEGTSLHVHLPTDGDFGTKEHGVTLASHARMAIECALPLSPSAYVLHVVTGQCPDPTHVNIVSDITEERRLWTSEQLGSIAALLPSRDMLCIENIETFPPDYWDRWINTESYSRCIDIGHLWKDGHDPAPLIKQWLPRTKVIHLHGLRPAEGEMPAVQDNASSIVPQCFPVLFGPKIRDHTSLKYIPDCCLDAVMHPLWDVGYDGVLNIEVFDYGDFLVSYEKLLASWRRHFEGRR